MKKKLWIIIVAVLLLVLIGGYLGYKIYYVNYYDLSHINEFEKSKDIFAIKDETITIKTTTLPRQSILWVCCCSRFCKSLCLCGQARLLGI